MQFNHLPDGIRLACVDVGTNSVKMLIAETRGGDLTRIFEQSVITRLGEGMRPEDRLIQNAPLERTADAIARFAQAARTHDTERILAVGTAALRDAANRDEAVQQIYERSGIKVRVIPGEEEARLSYLAVRRDIRWAMHPLLTVIDIGGGSTELIQGVPDSEEIAARHSANLGAVKLTERFLPSDPPTSSELEAGRRAAALAVQEALPPQVGARAHLVGVGGTLTTLAAMELETVTGPDDLHGHTISAAGLAATIELLASRSVAERKQLRNLDPARADIILGGALLLEAALHALNAPCVDVSARGLRWGAIYEAFENE